MADIVLNVEVRATAGTGAARLARREGKVPGVLYGGPLGPVSVSVPKNEFRKALYSGKLLGHLVTLKHEGKVQSVIAKDIQFHPVSDEPVHFDLYRVDEHQLIKIAVPVHFKNEDASPGMKRGGALTIALHEVQLEVPADSIPEELVVDLTGLDVGDSIRAADLKLPKGAKLAPHDRDATVASIGMSSAMQAEDATAEGEAAPPAA
ncbi:MAG: ribosomal protein L25/ral stress protein Ctc [Caulobacteraceae bacterium]|nr:ribosomal protein L25/ral stress protein Ctc [Caulobacteraceae bacterium]